MYLTTRGLVLREAKYKESDKILTILTETDGKISAKARGVQRTRSKIAAASQLLSFSDFTFFGSRGKWTINEAESLEQFRALRGDIELLALGSYIAELLEAVANENVPEPEILQLGLNALYALSNRLCPPAQVKAAFELRLMSLAGYRPQLDECAGCGRREPESGRLFPEHGELFCPECRAVGGLGMDRSVIDAIFCSVVFMFAATSRYDCLISSCPAPFSCASSSEIAFFVFSACSSGLQVPSGCRLGAGAKKSAS